MKIRIGQMLKLKPFDETDDLLQAGAFYASTRLHMICVVCSAALAVSALMLAILGLAGSLVTLAIAVALSAVTAGLEWNAGLRARALNQLFTTVIVTLCIAVLARVQ